MIYMILNIKTEDFYIGSTKDFNTRKARHLNELSKGTHHNIYLQRAYDKYGKEAFEIFEIHNCCVEDNLKEETIFIEALQPPYNIGPVGGGDNLTNHPNRDDIIRRRTLTHKATMEALGVEGRKLKYGKIGELNPNWKGGTSVSYCSCGNRKSLQAKVCHSCRDRTGENNPFFGKSHTEETKKKLSEKMKGNIPANSRKVCVEGEVYPSLSAAARACNITSGAMHYRVNSSSSKWANFFYLEEDS